MRNPLLGAALAAALIFAACGAREEDEPPTVTPTTPSAATATATTGGGTSPAATAAGTPAFFGTTDRTTRERPGATITTLTAVRVASQAGFDRIVFEFSGGLPGYQVEYVIPPTEQCGSGLPVEIAGEALLLVKFRPGQAHNDTGIPTVTDRELKPNLAIIREAELTCDFEGLVSWGVGVSAKNGYRVVELTGPDRIAVDILH
jgi:hypothetical protein